MRTAKPLAHGICFRSFAAAASSDASIPSNAFDCTFRFTHPSACREAEVQAPGQHSRIHSRPANFAPRGGFTDPPMVGPADLRIHLWWVLLPT